MYNPDEDYQVMLAKLKTICQNKNMLWQRPQGCQLPV